jgi:hypothetical protein
MEREREHENRDDTNPRWDTCQPVVHFIPKFCVHLAMEMARLEEQLAIAKDDFRTEIIQRQAVGQAEAQHRNGGL